MKGKMLLLMIVFLVASYFLYEYKSGNQKNIKKKNDNTITISGVVKGESDGVPVYRATISLQDSDEMALTNENGEFKIGAKKGQKLYVAHPHYKKKAVEVSGVHLDIKLQERDTE